MEDWSDGVDGVHEGLHTCVHSNVLHQYCNLLVCHLLHLIVPLCGAFCLY